MGGNAPVPACGSMENQCHLLANETFPNLAPAGRQHTAWGSLPGQRITPDFRVALDKEVSRRCTDIICIITTLSLVLQLEIHLFSLSMQYYVIIQYCASSVLGFSGTVR